MDRNSIIGIILITLILVLFWWVNTPSDEELKKLREQQEAIQKTELAEKEAREAIAQSTEANAAIESDTTNKAVRLAEQFGVFASAAEGTNEFVTLENNLMKVVLSTRGGRIYSVELKDYKAFDGRPLILFNGDNNSFGFKFTNNNRIYSTNELFFNLENNSTTNAELRLKAGDENYLSYQYKLTDDSYMVDFTVIPVNMQEIFGKNQSNLQLNWSVEMPVQEKGRDFEIQHSGIYYKFYQDDVDWINAAKDEEKPLTTKLQWVGFKDQFFSSVFISNTAFNSGTVRSSVNKDPEHPIFRYAHAELNVPLETLSNNESGFKFYFGPNHYLTLRKHKDLELDRLIHLGWSFLGWINRFMVIPVFNFLEKFIGSYGIIILILTILIKLVLFPLTYKSYLSTAKMKVLKPQIDEINSKIPKEKAMERQQAMMGLYKKAGVNPMGGCLPMLLQMPILIALFQFFPASIELRGEPFLWATDLSSYDSILQLPFNIPFYGDHVSLFCLLMAITNIVYTYMNQEMAASSQQMPGMKTMMYMMPVMFLFFFNSYASGLSYYYFISTLFTIGQTLLFRKFVDEKALLAKIHAHQKKPVKKSGFQQRLEEMARQQQLNKRK